MRNFVFIHIPKNAGTTIWKTLDIPELRKLPLIENCFDQKRGVNFGHIYYPLLVEAGYVSRNFDQSAFKFCFCRNPYDRAVSLYEYYLRTDKIRAMPFKEFLGRVNRGVPDIGLYNQKGWSQCNPQVRWIEGVDIDFVGRVENIEEDFQELCDILEYDAPNKLPVLNKSVDSDVESYYDSDTLALVNNFYREDFERFGYDRVLNT